jgi:chromosome segregation ATPase
MDQNTLKMVTAKIEKTLEQARVLKSEKADLEALAADLRKNLDEKDREIEELKNNNEQHLAEIRSLQEALNERDTKLDESEQAIISALDDLDKVLARDGGESGNGFPGGLFNVQEG